MAGWCAAGRPESAEIGCRGRSVLRYEGKNGFFNPNQAPIISFTGDPCLAAVVGVRLDRRVTEVIESGEVYWYRLDPRIIEAD